MTSPAESLNLDAAEVPEPLRKELDTLQKALGENMQRYTECKEIKVDEGLRTLEAKAGRLALSINSHKGILKRERMRLAETAKKLGLDQRIAHNVQRTRDNLAKNPQFGRVHSVDFLHEVATQNDQSLAEQCETVEKLRKLLDRLRNSDEEPSLSRNDLVDHLTRFDRIFEQVASQVYALNDSAEKLRDIFVEHRQKLGGHFALIDPFEKQKERRRLIDAYSALKGIDAFPSSNALLQLGEYFPKQQPGTAQPQFGMTQFGQPSVGGGLFGASKAPAFSFAPSAQQSSTNLFGTPKPTPFGMPTTTATAPSPFGAAAVIPTSAGVSAGPSLFGTSVSSAGVSSAPSQPTFGGFSNTLSSASSGTLFKGSAPAKPTNLFGSK
ncbi:hypothetical protein niasHT_007973 [Heterodera trifolii]|uniref:Uncharacterized protein n=1 Tax=Heterodera trifolii TaxID=157864 RepID=A0ABD2LZL5_9BILA